jgi:hypothetical protein
MPIRTLDSDLEQKRERALAIINSGIIDVTEAQMMAWDKGGLTYWLELWDEDEHPDGQLCPYDDCAHDLALPEAGWYICGHCGRAFWCRVSESDYEDYACYLPDEGKPPERPVDVPTARDLGPSWGTPSTSHK